MGFEVSGPLPYAPVTTPQAGSLVGDAAISATTLTEVFATSSLAVGTWLIHAQVTISSAIGGCVSEVGIVVKSATATITGAASGEGVHGTPGAGKVTIPLSVVAVVTVAGTLKVQAYCSAAATGLAATTGTGAMTAATGYTAIRIA